jgi:hypothetical protein
MQPLPPHARKQPIAVTTAAAMIVIAMTVVITMASNWGRKSPSLSRRKPTLAQKGGLE